MCNQEEKCKTMRNAALQVLIRKLEDERENGKWNQCRKIIGEIDGEISAYDCEAVQMLKDRIKSYQECEYHQQKIRKIDILIAELEAFIA